VYYPCKIVFFLENSSAISIQSTGSPDKAFAGLYVANKQDVHIQNNHNPSTPLPGVIRTIEIQISPKGNSEMFDPAPFDSVEGNCSLFLSTEV
jgi:hypothetical protein